MSFKSEKMIANYAIRSPKVVCIDENNKNLGLMSTADAIKAAYEVGLDLVQVSFGDKNTPPTARMADFNKMRFEAVKKAKEQQKKQRESIIKEHQIKFRPTTGENDLKFKASKTDEFLQDGDQVRVIIAFRGREVSHASVAHETFNKFLSMCNHAKVMDQPSMSFGGEHKACLSALLIKK